jgi:hypothetical protein
VTEELYPGQRYFHAENPRIRRAEENFMEKDRRKVTVADIRMIVKQLTGPSVKPRPGQRMIMIDAEGVHEWVAR